jgi:phage repressor protein C with HTH and peptisase S24 domain
MKPAQPRNRTITAADRAAAERLQRIWDEKARTLGVTQDTVAEIMDTTQGAISQFLRCKIALNPKAVLAFAKALNVDFREIRSDLPALRMLQEDAPTYSDGWIDIHASTQGAALGDGAAPDEYAETHKLKFRADSLSRKRLRPHKLQVFYGRGDSMEPRIHDGDALLVNTEETTPVHDAIFMVRWEGHFYAKRLKRLGRHWFLCSDNGSDPKWRDPVAVEDHHDFEIVGRVRWVGSWEG